MTSQPASRRQQMLIWLLMFLSIGMYYVVVRLVQPTGAQENPMLVRILLVMAVGLVGASFVVRSRLGAATETAAHTARIQQMRLIVALAFCEAAALCGVLVWFTTGWQYYYVFLLLGVVGQLLHYPGGPEE